MGASRSHRWYMMRNALVIRVYCTLPSGDETCKLLLKRLSREAGRSVLRAVAVVRTSYKAWLASTQRVLDKVAKQRSHAPAATASG